MTGAQQIDVILALVRDKGQVERSSNAIYFYPQSRTLDVEPFVLRYWTSLIFGIDMQDVSVEKLARRDRFVYRIKGPSLDIRILCLKDYKGCQATFRVDNAVGDCKVECVSKDFVASVKVAALLTAAGLSPEYSHPYWKATKL